MSLARAHQIFCRGRARKEGTGRRLSTSRHRGRTSAAARAAGITRSLPILLLVAGCSGTRPSTLGVHNGRFVSCPTTPNCVNSQAPPDDTEHAIEPLRYTGSAAAALERLVLVLSESLARIEIITRTPTYLHAEATSFIFRFVDDVEFFLPPDAKVIECRSAARLGASDMGVNRARIEEIRAAFDETSPASRDRGP